ncbi:rhomboid family intramembrane serine protease [Silicimonas sp. MF1-12-2]|uniref:rhomboid family intramembrane serine protease n=1 Tax=Silicimonas sp. MF1-12-2 TaxID=3384793 RepID=UPI0039B58510
MTADSGGAPTESPVMNGWGLVALTGLCTAIEIILQLGDLGAFGIPRFRQLIYEYGGFWPGLLKDWKPNYALQPATMFLTYGFLHAGLVHLVVNMIALFSLGRPVLERIGTPRALLLYVGALLGGAIGFALISDSYRPMVGASGALFGLAGALLAWDLRDRVVLQEQVWPVARGALLLAAMNVALYYATGGLLAWEAHLGGFVAGTLLALVINRRATPDDRHDD